MNRTGAKRRIWLLIGIAALAGVGVAAYNFGLTANHGTGVGHPMFGPMSGPLRGYGGGFGFGFGPFGFFGVVLIGFLLVWLFLTLLSAPARGSQPPSTDPASVERLRELVEMHDKGALGDDEFAAAKRKLLGL